MRFERVVLARVGEGAGAGLDLVHRLAAPGASVTTVRSSEPDETIAAAVARTSADLVVIVLPARARVSRRTLRRLEDVVAAANVTTCIAARDEPTGSFGRVLVPIRESAGSVASARLGAALAWEHEAELLLLHVLPVMDGASALPLLGREERAERLLARTRAALGGAACSRTLLRVGVVNDVVVRTAGEEGASVVVTSLRRRSWCARVLGSSLAGALLASGAVVLVPARP